jgi:hypothetical protein
MSMDERDPLLDKLHALPKHELNADRAAKTLRAAEAALPGKVRPGIRWPQFAIAIALSTAGIMYTVDSVHRLGDIYGSNQVASLGP